MIIHNVSIHRIINTKKNESVLFRYTTFQRTLLLYFPIKGEFVLITDCHIYYFLPLKIMSFRESAPVRIWLSKRKQCQHWNKHSWRQTWLRINQKSISQNFRNKKAKSKSYLHPLHKTNYLDIKHELPLTLFKFLVSFRKIYILLNEDLLSHLCFL